jgi:hypothetical protein
LAFCIISLVAGSTVSWSKSSSAIKILLISIGYRQSNYHTSTYHYYHLYIIVSRAIKILHRDSEGYFSAISPGPLGLCGEIIRRLRD